jgi:hypothetical protein
MSCSSPKKLGPESRQAAALNGCPIIINEGQSILFKMANAPNLVIGAAVVNGELAVWEIDPNGRNFEVVWKDSETWKTSTEFSDGDKRVTIIDKNGDGKADFMRIGTPADKRNGTVSDMVGFTAKEQEWEKMDTSNPSR